MKRISIVGCFAVVMALALTACNPPEYETIATSAPETTIVTEETETEITESSMTETSLSPVPTPVETTEETSTATELTESIMDETEETKESVAETKTTAKATPTTAPKSTKAPSSSGGSSTSTKKPTPIPTDPYIPPNTPTPTPKPTNTPTPSPTPKPAVAAKIKVTYKVYGSDDPDGEDNDVKISVSKTYTCQPKSGTKYHSKKIEDYTVPKVDSDWLRSEFYKVYPNGLVAGYGTTQHQLVGYADD